MASYKDDFLCSPQKHSGLPWRSPSPENGRRIVVEDVVEPFGAPSVISRPVQSFSNTSGYNYNDSQFINSPDRSRSPIHGTLASSADVNINGYEQTEVKLLYDNTSENEITNKYSSNLERLTSATRYDTNGAYDKSADTTVFALKKVDPYSIPLGEKENVPYRGPIVRTINQSTSHNLEKGAGYTYPIKVINPNPVSDERIEELSNRYRERMARQVHRETSLRQHNRSRSDNSINRENTTSVSEHRELCDNLIIKKYENAMLQIDKLEGNIKHLKLEVNTLQAAKNQGEMRVSINKLP